MNEAQTVKPTAIAASLTSTYGASAEKRPKVHCPPPAAFGDNALVDAKFSAAGGDVSVSWWHEKVRIGEAPKPVIRAPRFTRWNLGQVRQFWIDYVAKAAQDAQAETLKERATKASAAAKARVKASTAPKA